MDRIRISINDNILEKMMKFYDSQMIPFDDDHLILKAQAIGCDIEVSTEMIASFEGANALNEAKHWSRTLAKRIAEDKASSQLFVRHHIGAAETGSGDYIGPLCIVACYISEEDIDYVKSLNIQDVNELSNQEIINYAKDLKNHVISSLLVLDNSHYNKMINDGINQANIRARLFNQAIVNVLQKTKRNVEFKVIDQFVSPKTYFNYLKNEVIVVKDLIFENNSDQKYLGVLVAEIISRYAYLQYYASMQKSLKIKLARGTSAAVDNVAIKIIDKYGEKMLTKVAKLNFTNTKRIHNTMNKDAK